MPPSSGAGQVLIAGGHGYGTDGKNAAWIYDVAGATLNPIAPMSTARGAATAIVPPNGTVLVVGGFDANGAALDTAEIYAP